VCPGVHSVSKAFERGVEFSSPASSDRRPWTVAAKSVATGANQFPPTVVTAVHWKDFHRAVRSWSCVVRLDCKTADDERCSDFSDMFRDVLSRCSLRSLKLYGRSQTAPFGSSAICSQFSAVFVASAHKLAEFARDYSR